MTAPRPPSGPDWLHEIKLDGFRLMAQRRGVGGRLLTRNGNDWTDRYPSVLAAVNALKVKSCVIDGEITVCVGRGLPVFDLLRHGGRSSQRRFCSRSIYWSSTARTCGQCRSRRASASWVHLLDGAGRGLQISEHFTSTALKCSNTPASWVARASSASASVRATSPAAPTTGSRSRTRQRPP
jgi:ATP dependent DNA ligase domain